LQRSKHRVGDAHPFSMSRVTVGSAPPHRGSQQVIPKILMKVERRAIA